jgi:predicted metal-dependent hydrolase
MRATTIVFPKNRTNKSLQHLYRTFNRAYFANRLDDEVAVRFAKSSRVSWLGCYVGEFEVIYLNPILKKSWRMTCMVLLHEMCHVAIPGQHNHGPKFQKAMHALANCGAFESIW